MDRPLHISRHAPADWRRGARPRNRTCYGRRHDLRRRPPPATSLWAESDSHRRLRPLKRPSHRCLRGGRSHRPRRCLRTRRLTAHHIRPGDRSQRWWRRGWGVLRFDGGSRSVVRLLDSLGANYSGAWQDDSIFQIMILSLGEFSERPQVGISEVSLTNMSEVRNRGLTTVPKRAPRSSSPAISAPQRRGLAPLR